MSDTIVVSDDGQLAQAYQYLQRVVGLIAITLPLIVAGGDKVLDGQSLRGSISAYYYGRTGGYFVGSLFALAVFFLSYDYRPRENRTADNRMSTAASAAAVGVALLPTASEGGDATGSALVVGTLHLICAGALFSLLAAFSLYQFTKTGGESAATLTWGDRLMRVVRTKQEFVDKMTPHKKIRNKVYRVCGWIIVACIGLILVSNTFDWGLLFWLESIAVVAFGVSWLVKGEAFGILADDPPSP